MKIKGWVKLHRAIQSNWVWEDKPFSKGQAWLDLVMMANHKVNKFVLGNELIEVERGQFITSELKLMERWGWGKSKTRGFLKLLEEDGMIIKKSDRQKTTINIVNYTLYQDSETTDEPQADHERTTNEPQTDHKPDTNKKDKKDKKDNSASDVDIFFEDIWNLYPNKKGKSAIKTAAKKKLLSLGKESLVLAIKRYKEDLEQNTWKQPMMGNTFFNGRYEDYLEKDKEQEEEVVDLQLKPFDPNDWQ